MKSAAKLSGLGWSGGIATEPGRMVKGAGQILDEVAFRFQPDREPDQRIEDAGLCASLRAHAEMGHGGGVGCQAFDAAKGFGQGEQAKRPEDRKSVVYGKSGSVSVDPGGRRIIKKK